MTKSLTDEQALHAKRDLQTAPKIAPKKKLASGPNQHTRPHHSTHMSIPGMVIPTNKLRYTKIQRNLIFTH